jgi:hypothetical protein
MPTRPKHQRGVGPPIPPFWAPASVCCALYCQSQRDELKTYIQYSYGQSGWEELLRIEAQVRKRKQETDHRAAEIKEMLITITIVTLVLAAGIAGLALLAYLLWASQQ